MLVKYFKDTLDILQSGAMSLYAGIFFGSGHPYPIVGDTDSIDIGSLPKGDAQQLRRGIPMTEAMEEGILDNDLHDTHRHAIIGRDSLDIFDLYL